MKYALRVFNGRKTVGRNMVELPKTEVVSIDCRDWPKWTHYTILATNDEEEDNR